jgi:hypothetical protein
VSETTGAELHMRRNRETKWTKVMDELGQVDHYAGPNGATIQKGHDPRPTVRRSPECWYLTVPGKKRPMLFARLSDAQAAYDELS